VDEKPPLPPKPPPIPLPPSKKKGKAVFSSSLTAWVVVVAFRIASMLAFLLVTVVSFITAWIWLYTVSGAALNVAALAAMAVCIAGLIMASSCAWMAEQLVFG